MPSSSKETCAKDFEVQNSILDADGDESRFAASEKNDERLLNVDYYYHQSRIWDPVNFLDCCGPTAATEQQPIHPSLSLSLLSSSQDHHEHEIPPMMMATSEMSSDLEDAIDRLLRSRPTTTTTTTRTNHHQKGTSYTRINHIRQLETWDCGRYNT